MNNTREHSDRNSTVQTEQTENLHNQTDSIIISGACKEIISQAKLSRPQKRRASTPVPHYGSKLMRLELSPIKELG